MSETDSFDRFPNIKVRLIEDGIRKLAESLEGGGFFSATQPKVTLLDDGIMISFMANLGVHPTVTPFPVDIFLPLKEETHGQVN